MSAWAGQARRLAPGDVPAAAKALGVPVAALRAVLAVEARGTGFDAAGRPIILYEPHVFHRQLKANARGKLADATGAGLAYPAWGTKPYPKGQDAQYARLDAASAIDPECAARACSWGMGQILGENYGQAGYKTALDLVAAFQRSEADQVGAMLRLVKAWGLVPALVSLDWARFARRYNGPGQVAKYSAMLADAYTKAVKAGDEATAKVPAPIVAKPKPAPARVLTADDLNAAQLAKIAAPSTDDLNAAELRRIKGDA